MDRYETFSRTARLLALDVFGSEDDDDSSIIDGLQASVIRIVADRRNVTSPAGQTAVATLVGQVAMLGVTVDLDIADVPLAAPQPPFAGPSLEGVLETYSSDLLGAEASTGAPALTLILGDTPWPGGGAAFRVCGDEWRFRIVPGEGPDKGNVWDGAAAGAFGAFAAASAGAAEALRAALPRVANAVGQPVAEGPWWSLDVSRPVEGNLRVDGLDALGLELGHVNIISSGAITNAMLYCLLRASELRGSMRTFDADVMEMSNLNRYPLAILSDLGRYKVDAVADHSTGDLKIEGFPVAFAHETIETIGGLGPTVLVGVDDIPSRWAVQRAAPGWVGVGATSHGFVMVSAHEPDQACAGCAHPRDEALDGPIPTISFVSFWAGLLQARALVAHAANVNMPAVNLASPFGLFGPRGLQAFPLSPAALCPVGCMASRRLANN